MSKVVIALGGNALGNTPKQQQQLLKHAVKNIVPLIKRGDKIVITHGNGPQVGIINLAFEDSFENKDIPYMPFPECTAMSQGYIGYHIQKEIKKQLEEEGIKKEVITVLTQVVVEKSDPAFKNPSKPVGPFYSQKEAKMLMERTGETYIEDAGRGYRKVVASPKPIDIIEFSTIDKLLKDDNIVIACGGGGIPVFKENKSKGASAVVDKDLASSLLAKKINANKFIILTNINQAEINFNTKDAKPIGKISIDELKKYIKEGQFAKGSMLPKIEAAISFVEKTGGKSIITSLNNLDNGIHEIKSTVIYK